VGRDHPDFLARRLRRSLGGEDHVLRVREHDDTRFCEGVDGCGDVRRGRVHRLAALDADRTEALKKAAISCSQADGHGARHARLTLEAHRPLRGLDVHVLDVDLLDLARGRGERERAPGLVRVHVHLDRPRTADDE
jgi:hypothetical protein